jgi:hypothetical protein
MGIGLPSLLEMASIEARVTRGVVDMLLPAKLSRVPKLVGVWIRHPLYSATASPEVPRPEPCMNGTHETREAHISCMIQPVATRSFSL